MYEIVDPIKSVMLAILLGVAIVALIIGSVAASSKIINNKKEAVENIKKQAIENNCAQYNPTTGNFEWIKK
jgi:flagellar basal body-associated protein FliL